MIDDNFMREMHIKVIQTRLGMAIRDRDWQITCVSEAEIDLNFKRSRLEEIKRECAALNKILEGLVP